MLVVVRHAEAEVRVVGGPSDAERPLTARGRSQAEALVDRLVALGTPTVCSSPYRRAVETVAPAAAALGTEPAIVEDAREWNDGFATIDDWLPRYEQCWRDADHRFGDGETHRELAARAATCLRELLDRAGDEPVVLASHGTWISRGMEALGVPVTLDFWRAMPLPAVYEVRTDAATFAIAGPGLP